MFVIHSPLAVPQQLGLEAAGIEQSCYSESKKIYLETNQKLYS